MIIDTKDDVVMVNSKDYKYVLSKLKKYLNPIYSEPDVLAEVLETLGIGWRIYDEC